MVLALPTVQKNSGVQVFLTFLFSILNVKADTDWHQVINALVLIQ